MPRIESPALSSNSSLPFSAPSLDSEDREPQLPPIFVVGGTDPAGADLGDPTEQPSDASDDASPDVLDEWKNSGCSSDGGFVSWLDDDDVGNSPGPDCNEPHFFEAPPTKNFGLLSEAPSSSCPELVTPPATKARAPREVMSTLKKRWKYVKKAGAKSTASASKSISSISASYFSGRGEASSSTRETREERCSRLADEWVASILPSWRKKRNTNRVRSLTFQGVPASVRARVWQCAIGNPLQVSEALFDVLKERARAGRMEYMRGRETLALADGDVGGLGGQAEALMESERSAHKAIMLDLPRTFPDLSFFHAEGSHYEFALRDVLEAFLYLKPDVGYSQGMSFLAAVLLLYMDPYEAFCCFVNMLLHKSCFLHFFKIKMPEVKFYLTIHEKLLGEEMPLLHAHFKQHGIESNLYMINWVMSLYCRALPLEFVTRIWDVYILDGDIAIFRAALGILRLFMPKLLEMNFEDMAYFLSHIPAEEIEPDGLLHSIRSVRVVTKKHFHDLFKECEAEHRKNYFRDEG